MKNTLKNRTARTISIAFMVCYVLLIGPVQAFSALPLSHCFNANLDSVTSELTTSTPNMVDHENTKLDCHSTFSADVVDPCETGTCQYSSVLIISAPSITPAALTLTELTERNISAPNHPNFRIDRPPRIS